MFLHKFDILNRNQNGLFQKLLPVCDEIMRRDEIRWFDGTHLNGRGQTPLARLNNSSWQSSRELHKQKGLQKHLSRLQPDYIK